MSALEIKVMYHTDIEPIQQAHDGEWYDLRVAEDTFIPLGEYRLVSLGVSIKLPEGYEAHVVPRSSTFKHYGLIQTNSCGIIDNSYSGPNDVWRFPCYCLEGKDIVNGKKGTMLHKNDRVCQMRIVQIQPECDLVTVREMEGEDRGGIGSTGIK